METLERVTVGKVGSSSLINPQTLEVIDSNFADIACQMINVSNGVLVSSGGILAGKMLGYKGNLSMTASAGWAEVMNIWAKYMGSIQPSILATEKDFYPLSYYERFINFLKQKQIYEPRFKILVENFTDAWCNGKIPITNQNDAISKLGLAPEIIKFRPGGKVEFHGDNDLYASTIAISMLENDISNNVSLIILSGSKKGVLDDSNKTIPILDVQELSEIMSNRSDSRSREGSNGFRTKFKALSVAAERGVDTYLGSATDPKSILQASTGLVGGNVTKIVHSHNLDAV